LGDLLKKVNKQLNAMRYQADDIVEAAGGRWSGSGWGHISFNDDGTGIRIYGQSEYGFYGEGADLDAAIAGLSRLGRKTNLRKYWVDIDSYM
jgi:hypothetical protein